MFPNFAVALLAAALLGACRTAFLGVQAALLGEAVPAELRGPVLALSGTINQVAQVVGIVGGAAVTLTLGVRTALLIDVAHLRRGCPRAAVAAADVQRAVVARPRPLDGVRAVLAEPTLRRLAPVAWTCMVASLLPETLAAVAVPDAWVPAAMAASPFGGAIGYLLAGRTSLLDTVASIFRAQTGLGIVLLAGRAGRLGRAVRADLRGS